MINDGDGFFYVVGIEEVQGQSLTEGWYFWNEVGLIGGGPYVTKEIAHQYLIDYFDMVLDNSLRAFERRALGMRKTQIHVNWVEEGF